MMRFFPAVLLVIALPAMAHAQSAVAPPPASGSLPPIGLPLPPIGLPLPSIGLPLPAMGLPPAADQTPRDAGRRQPAESGGGGRRDAVAAQPIVFFVPTYAGWSGTLPGQIAPPAPPAAAGGSSGAAPSDPEQKPRTGFIRLDVKPARTHMFLNGEFIGTSEDFNNAVELEAGRHLIEFRAANHETVMLPVNMTAGQTITYQQTLKRSATASEPQRPAAPVSSGRSDRTRREEPPPAPSTYYFIPGCYMGNVPPAQVPLPAGCDMSRLITRTK